MVSATIESICWNDSRTFWLMENVARGLGCDPPPPGTEEFEWVTAAFTDSGKLQEALEVLGDACRAQRCARPTLRETPAARPPAPSGIRVTRPK
jgi:hypothetical protein